MFLSLILTLSALSAFAFPQESHILGKLEAGNASFTVSPEVRGISEISLKKLSLQTVFQLKNSNGDVLAYSKHAMGKKKSEFKLFSGSRAIRAQVQMAGQNLDILNSQKKLVSHMVRTDEPAAYEFRSLDGTLFTRLIRISQEKPEWKLEVYEDDELSPEIAIALAAYESRFEIQDFDRILGFPIPSKQP